MKPKIVKLHLYSKNNIKTGRYLYSPVAFFDGKYFYCDSLIKTSVTKISDIKDNEIVLTREIPQQFLKANGINI
jgi:hypothetical protein